MADTLPTIGPDISASTIKKWMSGFTDQLFNNNPVIRALKSTSKTQKGLPPQSRAYRTLDGGEYIRDTALINETDAAEWIIGDDTHDPSFEEVLKPVQWPWAMIVKTCGITDYDRSRNSGASKMVDMWQARIYEATENMMKELETRMLGKTETGLTGVSGYKKINGLASLTPEDPTSGVVGGLDRVTWTQWRNEYVTTCGSVGGATAGPANRAKLVNQWATCFTNGHGVRWDLMLAGLTAWVAWENYLSGTGQVLFQKADDPDWGFPVLRFMGAPLLPSSRVAAADQIYGLVTKFLVFAVNSQMDMEVEDVGGGTGQWIKVRKISHMCQFFARKFNVMGVSADWSA